MCSSRGVRRCLLGWAAAVASVVSGLGCATPGPDPAAPAAATPAVPAPPGQDRVPGQYLVQLAPGADRAVLPEVYGRWGLQRVQDLGRDLFLLTLSEDPGPQRMSQAQQADPRIRSVQPNFVYCGDR